MLTLQQISEIREHLEKAQNPVFFFDNDQDGLCSYLILRRFLGRGRGVPVKTNPMQKDYFRRVLEFNPDAIFILDVPEVNLGFFEEVKKLNLPIIWIDHHKIPEELIPKDIAYYNSFSKSKNEGETVTSICYNLTKRKEDLWIGVAGAVSDREIPEFYEDFLKEYPDLGIKSKDAFEIFYGSEIGKIARIFGAGLKDRTTNVMNMIRFTVKAKTPYEISNKSSDNAPFYERFEELDEKLSALVNKAKEGYDGGKVLFFKYAGETSMSADLSNKLSYLYPKPVIIVAYLKGNFVNLSLRGKNIKEDIVKIIEKIEGARGGGHNNAVGAQILSKDLDFFVEEIKKVFS